MTNKQKILQWLRDGKMIDNITANKLCGTFSLKQYINELRNAGLEIKDIWCRNKETGNMYKRWFLIAPNIRRQF